MVMPQEQAQVGQPIGPGDGFGVGGERDAPPDQLQRRAVEQGKNVQAEARLRWEREKARRQAELVQREQALEQQRIAYAQELAALEQQLDAEYAAYAQQVEQAPIRAENPYVPAAPPPAAVAVNPNVLPPGALPPAR